MDEETHRSIDPFVNIPINPKDDVIDISVTVNVGNLDIVHNNLDIVHNNRSMWVIETY